VDNSTASATGKTGKQIEFATLTGFFKVPPAGIFRAEMMGKGRKGNNRTRKQQDGIQGGGWTTSTSHGNSHRKAKERLSEKTATLPSKIKTGSPEGKKTGLAAILKTDRPRLCQEAPARQAGKRVIDYAGANHGSLARW
jgi:hypothetical protein